MKEDQQTNLLRICSLIDHIQIDDRDIERIKLFKIELEQEEYTNGVILDILTQIERKHDKTADKKRLLELMALRNTAERESIVYER